MTEADAQRRRGLRQLLEDDFRELVRLGILPDHGEREIIFRLTDEGLIRWFEPRPVRLPASELERT